MEEDGCKHHWVLPLKWGAYREMSIAEWRFYGAHCAHCFRPKYLPASDEVLAAGPDSYVAEPDPAPGETPDAPAAP